MQTKSDWDARKSYEVLQSRLIAIRREPSRIDNRLSEQTKNHRHVKPPPEIDIDLVQKENRILLERLTLISKRKKEAEITGRIDFKAISKRLRLSGKKAESRRIATENEALIKRILNTPTTVPKKITCDKLWKKQLKLKQIRANVKKCPFQASTPRLPPLECRKSSSTRNLKTADFPFSP